MYGSGTRAASSILGALGPRLATKSITVRRKFVRLRFFALVTWPLVAWVPAELLIVDVDLPHADAIVVLRGGKAYIERTERAAQLFREGRAPLVLLTIEVGIAVTEHTTLHSLLWWLFPSGWHTVAEEYARFGYYLVRYH